MDEEGMACPICETIFTQHAQLFAPQWRNLQEQTVSRRVWLVLKNQMLYTVLLIILTGVRTLGLGLGCG